MLNIFPRCKNALHEFVDQSFVIREIFNRLENNGKFYDIPYIVNLENESPITMCFKLKMYKNIEFLFSKLKNAPIDHHSRALQDSIPQAIEAGL